jgi:hypothetical protein
MDKINGELATPTATILGVYAEGLPDEWQYLRMSILVSKFGYFNFPSTLVLDCGEHVEEFSVSETSSKKTNRT